MIGTLAEVENYSKIESTMAVYQFQIAELHHKNFSLLILSKHEETNI